jgi:hypothetical protein
MNCDDYFDYLWSKFTPGMDYHFLDELHLPYNNVYFLVCLAEVINNLRIENKKFKSTDEAFNYSVERASELYNNINVSSVFMNYLSL